MRASRIVLAASLLGILLSSPQAAVAAPVPDGVKAATENAAVRLPARGDTPNGIGPAVQIARETFPAGARLVTVAVSATPAPGSSPRAMMLSVDLTCGGQTAQATTNVVSGGTLTPRLLVQDGGDCKVIARSARSGARAADGLMVTTRWATLDAAWGAVANRPDGWPDVVRKGTRFDAVPITLAVPGDTHKLQITGDMKITTCTSVGGSRENGSPYMCHPARINRKGSKVVVALVAEQSRADGGVCNARVVSQRTVHIDGTTHHGMISQQGSYTVVRTPGCTGDVRVEQRTRVLSGAEIVVHRKGTVTNVYGEA